MKPLVLVVIGTRPEAIKMAPVVHALRKSQRVEVRLLSTGQHRDLVASALRAFGLAPQDDLKVMRPGRSLSSVAAAVLEGVDGYLSGKTPRLVLGHGDTTTCFATALACFYRGIPFAHVEAGLRSGDLSSPFPEEFHRRAVARYAHHHFAPDSSARTRLMAEGVSPAAISVTGNPGVDALRAVLRTPPPATPTDGPQVVVTWHRREGRSRRDRLVERLKEAASLYPHLRFCVPLHPSPEVRGFLEAQFSGQRNFRLLPPLDYPEFIALLSRSRGVLTDSGGVQEEAALLGRPALILRDHSERAVGGAGKAVLVGSDGEGIPRHLPRLLADPCGSAPLPRGGAARRIARVVEAKLRGGLP